MSTSTVLSAVSAYQWSLRQDSMLVHPAHSTDGRRQRMLLTDVMRDYLKSDDVNGLCEFMQGALGRHPDTMSDIMEEVFGRLLCRDWAEFELELAAE